MPRADNSTRPDDLSEVKPRRPTEHQLQELVEETGRCLDHLFKIRRIAANYDASDSAALEQAICGVEDFVKFAHDPTSWASLLWLGEELPAAFLLGDMRCHCYHHAVYRMAHATLFIWPRKQNRSVSSVTHFIETLHARGLVLSKENFRELCAKVSGEAKLAAKQVRTAGPIVKLLDAELEIVSLLRRHGARLGAKEIADRLPKRPEPNVKFRQMLSDLVKRGVLDNDRRAGGYGLVQ